MFASDTLVLPKWSDGEAVVAPPHWLAVAKSVPREGHALRAFPDWLAWQIPTATCPIVGDVVDSAAGAFWPGLRRKAGDPRGCNSTRPDPGTVGAAVLHPEPGLQTRMEGGRHVAVTLVRGSHARSGTSGGGLLTPSHTALPVQWCSLCRCTVPPGLAAAPRCALSCY